MIKECTFKDLQQAQYFNTERNSFHSKNNYGDSNRNSNTNTIKVESPSSRASR